MQSVRKVRRARSEDCKDAIFLECKVVDGWCDYPSSDVVLVLSAFLYIVVVA